MMVDTKCDQCDKRDKNLTNVTPLDPLGLPLDPLRSNQQTALAIVGF